MNMILWLALMIGLLVVEAMTYALTTIWFAIGALAAAIAAYLSYPMLTQVICFGAVSLVLLLLTRPLALRYMKKGMPKTNVSSYIGRQAIVIEKIDNRAQTGRVRLYDVEWMAQAKEDGQIFSEGEVVEILEVHGVRLTVGKPGEKTP